MITGSPSRASKSTIALTVNGKPTSVSVHSMERLLDVLRHELQLTGTKEGCGEGECGSCSILMNGKLVNSCLIPALQAAGASIITIEAWSKALNSVPCKNRSWNAAAPNAASARPG